MPTHETIWTSALNRLQESLDTYDFSNWFSKTRAMKLDDDTLIIGVPSQFYADWIKNHFSEKVSASIDGLGASQVVFVPDSILAEQGQPAGVITTQRVIREHSAYKPTPVQSELAFAEPQASFDTYVQHAGNVKALRMCKVFAESAPGTYFPIVILVGPPGTGKTTLMRAMRRRFWQTHPNRNNFRSELITAKKFIATFVAATHGRDKQASKWIDELRKCQLLGVDDLHLITGPGSQNELFTIIKGMTEITDQRQERGQVIITMNCSLSELKLAEPWMSSVLKRGSFIFLLEPPDMQARIAILRSKVEKWNPTLPVTDEALEIIASQVDDGDGRDLEGTLQQIRTEAMLDGGSITAELTRQVIATRKGVPIPKKVTADNIIEAVATGFGIKVSDIKGRSREQRYALPRQIACWMCKRHTDLSPKSIGIKFGKDRNIVSHAMEVVPEKLQSDPVVANNVEQIERKLGLVPSINTP